MAHSVGSYARPRRTREARPQAGGGGAPDGAVAHSVGAYARPRRTREARPHAGGGGGKECAARHERSNDWPQGGAAPITRKPIWRAALPLTRISRPGRVPPWSSTWASRLVRAQILQAFRRLCDWARRRLVGRL